MFALCDECHAPIAGVVWIVAGPVAVFGKCGSCGGWFSLRELTELRPGGAGRGDAPGGICVNCAG